MTTPIRWNFALSLLLGALVLLSSSAVFAQAPRYVSPRRTVSLEFPRDNNKKISIDYGSPEAHGRKVFGGDMVPFDKVWRLGANKATHLTTDYDLVIGGQTIPAGTYSLFAVPSKDKWTLKINKATGMWGIPYKPEYDATELAKVDLKVETMSATQERFVITLAQTGNDNSLIFEWENTRASVGFTIKK